MAPEYSFSSEKNHLLKETRGLSFEEIIAAIENGQLLGHVDIHLPLTLIPT
jgi:hypothetical protein